MKYLILSVLCLLIISTGVNAMIETLNLDELVGRSQMVVSARVTAIITVPRTAETSALYADLPEPMTFLDNELEIVDCCKGNLKAGEKVSIRSLGGFEDAAAFALDRVYLLFLAANKEGRYEVVNSPQGCWPVEADGKFGGMGFETTLDQVKAAIR